MSLMTFEAAPVPAPAKAARKRSAKTARPQDADKVKATLHLSDRAMKTLGVYAVMTGNSNSAIVENLILENLRRFVVSDRAKGAEEVTVERSAN